MATQQRSEEAGASLSSGQSSISEDNTNDSDYMIQCGDTSKSWDLSASLRGRTSKVCRHWTCSTTEHVGTDEIMAIRTVVFRGFLPSFQTVDKPVTSQTMASNVSY